MNVTRRQRIKLLSRMVEYILEEEGKEASWFLDFKRRMRRRRRKKRRKKKQKKRRKSKTNG